MMIKKRFSEPKNRYTRAQQHRSAAAELTKAGYPVMAQVNTEMANFLDPPRREEDYEEEEE